MWAGSFRYNSIGDPGATVDVTLCRNNFIADPGALQYMQYMGASVDVTSARDGETPGARPADRVPVAVRSIAARRSKPQTSTQSPWRTGTGAGGGGHPSGLIRYSRRNTSRPLRSELSGCICSVALTYTWTGGGVGGRGGLRRGPHCVCLKVGG